MKLIIKQKNKVSGIDLIIVPVSGKSSLDGIIKEYPGSITDLKKRKFKFSEGDKLFTRTGQPEHRTLILIGAGSPVNKDRLRKLAKNIMVIIKDLKQKTSFIDLSQLDQISLPQISEFFDYLYLNSYSFKKYISDKNLFSPESVTILINKKKGVQKVLKEQNIINRVVVDMRNLINEIPAVVTPGKIKSTAMRLSAKNNLHVEIYEDDILVKEKLNGLLNVGSGSIHKPLMVKLSYVPEMYKKEITVVGKGITYDSGGLNIKPGSHMSTMKSDMSGSAIALGIIDLVSCMKLPVKLTSFLPVAENMPGHNSYKPDDIIVFRNGKSVEIVNTDAEGRLVLADAIILASEEKPDFIIELSTLTGSIVSALGNSIAGLFTLNRNLSKTLISAGEETGEFVWEMPMYQGYKSSIKSKISDLKNADYGNASSIKAGLFLNEFAGKVPFVHIDIAGTAFIEKENEYHGITGSTGFGVRLLYNFIKSIL